MLPSQAMRIEIICTGDEVLTGQTVNTNFSYISQALGGRCWTRSSWRASGPKP
jgi:hypothetical protein